MIKILCVLLAASVPFIGLAQTVETLASISGQVVDEAGKAIPGASVLLSKQNEYVRDVSGHRVLSEPGYRKLIKADSVGSFQTAGIVAGTYRVCALTASPAELSGCTWEAVPFFQVLAGASVSGVRARVLKAVRVQFEVQDPLAKVSAPDRFGNVEPSRRLFIGATNGVFYRPAVQTPISGGRLYTVMVPLSQTIRPFIDTDLPLWDQGEHSRGVARAEH